MSTLNGPLTKREKRESRHIVAALGDVTWFHGGLPGRAPGGLLLPARLTGADPRGEGVNTSDRTSYVYVTPRLDVAIWYAEEISSHTVYAVEPVGEVFVDPWVLRTPERVHAGTMFCATSAKVMEVLRTDGPAVREDVALLAAILRATTPKEHEKAVEATIRFADACRARGEACESIEAMLTATTDSDAPAGATCPCRRG